METILELKRIAKKPTYTIGKLYMNGEYLCDTLEDVDRNLDMNMSLSEIQQVKIKHQTAIPTGKYKINFEQFSPKFGNRPFYKQVCNGLLPRLENVPGFDGVLIHCGNTIDDTSGCLLIGKNKIRGQVVESQETFKRIYPILYKASQTGDVWITIK